MNEDILNMSLRKFLKKVGITAQREIEMAVRNAAEAGRLPTSGKVKAAARLTLEGLGLDVVIDGTIELE